jgi:hypothetical protein
MGKVKIPYYVVIKGHGYWRPKKEMREQFGFAMVRCGRDGPAAWAVAQTWAQRWQRVRRGEDTAPNAINAKQTRDQIDEARFYPPGSIGEAFRRFRKTDPWRKKAKATRDEWWRVWDHIQPFLGDIDPSTVTLEDISAIRGNVESRISLREAHRVIKVWRALWVIMAALKYCRLDEDPSFGLVNNAAKPRKAKWDEGEVVRLAKAAWRMGYSGLAAVIGVSWDTQLSPVDVRGLTAAQKVVDARGLAFILERAKTGRAAIGTLSRRTERIVDTYIDSLGFELHDNAPIFRSRGYVPTKKGGRPRIGSPYTKDSLGDDFRTVRAAVFGPEEKRKLSDFRRSGAIEALVGGADAETISAKMANTLSVSNELHHTYLPVEISKVREADQARITGRRKHRENK